MCLQPYACVVLRACSRLPLHASCFNFVRLWAAALGCLLKDLLSMTVPRWVRHCMQKAHPVSGDTPFLAGFPWVECHGRMHSCQKILGAKKPNKTTAFDPAASSSSSAQGLGVTLVDRDTQFPGCAERPGGQCWSLAWPRQLGFPPQCIALFRAVWTTDTSLEVQGGGVWGGVAGPEEDGD